jgi:hypothetical protein
MHLAQRYLGTALALAVAFISLFNPNIASAHERRDVGPYQFVVGFIAEPAILGEPNGIDLRVIDKASQRPVESVEKTLKAAIAFGGGQARELALRTRFNMPGSYTADLIPTRAGTYVFTFSGSIDGQQVNERFESGPGRFNDVQSRNELSFPVVEASPAELQQALNDARQQASTATMVGTVGLVLGLAALALAGYLFARARTSAPRRVPAVRGASE